jgi:hypothetical protein
MREPPLAIGSQQLLQPGQPIQIVQERQGARLGPRPVVGQAGEQRGVIRRIPGELLDRVEPEHPAAGRSRQRRALHRLEPVLAGQQALVDQHRGQVAVGEQEAADLPWRRNQPEGRPGDDGHLSEPGAHRIEQAPMAVRRAGEDLPPARDHPQLQDVVAHHSESPGPAADASNHQRAADRQVEVVGEDGRGEAPRQGGREHLPPGGPGVDHHPVALDILDGPEPPQFGDDAIVGLRAPEHRVAPSLGRELQIPPGGPADRGRHVLLRRRQQDPLWDPAHKVPEVIGRGRSRPVVEADLTVQWWG